MEKKNFKSGFVAIVGKPNAGKSTLLNSFLGQKLSIVTPKAQTTRNKITGILTGKNYQIVFFDTPGIFEPSYKLQQYMVKNAMKSALEADLILLMIDTLYKPDDSEKNVIKMIKEIKKKTVLVLNKVDKIPDKGLLLPLIAEYNAQYGFDEIVPISALKGDGVSKLLDIIIQSLSDGGMYYPEDEISDMPERFFVAEIIREKLFMQTQEEIPYSATVQTDEMKTREDGKMYIRATIYVERDSQKGIIIGNKGSMLKKIGQEARESIERWLDAPVYLDLWVSVKSDWRDKDFNLREFGYNP
ncbi:MAG: GTPase Era [Candidatus Poribacteria bacterium]